jgi:hypothetical protein
VLPILHSYGILDIGGSLFVSIYYSVKITVFYISSLRDSTTLGFMPLPILHPYGIFDVGSFLFISILLDNITYVFYISSLRDSATLGFELCYQYYITSGFWILEAHCLYQSIILQRFFLLSTYRPMGFQFLL